MTPALPQDLIARVTAAAGESAVDWDAVRRAGIERRGLPVPVATAPLPRISERAD